MSDTPPSSSPGAKRRLPTDPPRSEDPLLTHSLREHGPGRLVFERFRLQRELGEGGMGVVWLALDERLDSRPTALKFLPGLIVRDEEAIADLRREIRHGLDINHPGIVRVFDLHESKAEHLAAIAMEFIEGDTLSGLKAKRQDRCFDPAEIYEWVCQLCDILTYLHEEARVVHRDLKPRNLMINARGRLKLADFGIAAAISESHSRLSISNGSNGSGTPAYMSPQQALGRAARPSDDIYALGATLYELLTGKPPFYRARASALLQVIQTEMAPSIGKRRVELQVHSRPAVPLAWQATIAACLSKEPQDRPESVAAVLQALTIHSPPTISPSLAQNLSAEVSQAAHETRLMPLPYVKEDLLPKQDRSSESLWSKRTAPLGHQLSAKSPESLPSRNLFATCCIIMLAASFSARWSGGQPFGEWYLIGTGCGLVLGGLLARQLGIGSLFWIGLTLQFGGQLFRQLGRNTFFNLERWGTNRPYPLRLWGETLLADAGSGIWIIVAIVLTLQSFPAQRWLRLSLLSSFWPLGCFLAEQSAGDLTSFSVEPFFSMLLLGIASLLFVRFSTSTYKVADANSGNDKEEPFGASALVQFGLMATLFLTVAGQWSEESNLSLRRNFPNNTPTDAGIFLFISSVLVIFLLPAWLGSVRRDWNGRADSGAFLAALLLGSVVGCSQFTRSRWSSISATGVQAAPLLSEMVRVAALFSLATGLPWLRARVRASPAGMLAGCAASSSAGLLLAGEFGPDSVIAVLLCLPLQVFLVPGSLLLSEKKPRLLGNLQMALLVAAAWMAMTVTSRGIQYMYAKITESRTRKNYAGFSEWPTRFLAFPEARGINRWNSDTSLEADYRSPARIDAEAKKTIYRSAAFLALMVALFFAKKALSHPDEGEEEGEWVESDRQQPT